MVTIRQLSVTDVLDDGYQIAVWGAPTGDTRRAAMSTVADYLGTEGSITLSKLTMQSDRILGRTTASDGAIQELTVGDGLTLTAGDLSADVVSVNGATGDVVLEPGDITASYTYSSSPIDVEPLPFYTSGTLNGRVPQIALDDTGKPFVLSGIALSAYATSGAPAGSTIPTHGTSGRLRVGTPSAGTDATTKTYVDNLIDTRLTAAQRSAINALTSGSTAADIVAALQAS